MFAFFLCRGNAHGVVRKLSFRLSLPRSYVLAGPKYKKILLNYYENCASFLKLILKKLTLN